MKLAYLTLSLLFPSYALLANIDFSSDSIAYSETEMLLDGNVKISSEFGTIVSSKGKLIKASKTPTADILVAKLQEEVILTLLDSTVITCDEVTVDLENKSATISSHDSWATFQDNNQGLQVELSQGKVFWDEWDGKYHVKSLIASNGATFTYNGIKVFTDVAEYHTQNGKARLWKLSPSGKKGRCSIIFENNALEAKSICFNPVENLFTISNALGNLSDVKGGACTLETRTLFFKPDTSILQLAGPSTIEAETFGSLSCDKRMTITLLENHYPEKIIAKGNIVFKHPEYLVNCAGKMQFNPETTALSAEGIESPIVCQKEEMKIVADAVQTMPSEEAFEFVGNVRIKHPYFGASAGMLSYTPLAGNIALRSKDEVSVAIWDASESLKISADGLEVRRSEEGEFEVAGLGHVCFAFEKDNIKQLHKVMRSCLTHLF